MIVRIKRVYEPAKKSDGKRILIDRLWPRGLTKEEASIDTWIKDVAPSTALRKWFGHDPAKWEQFQRKYKQELAQSDALGALRELLATGKATLVYAAKDEKHNDAVVLKSLLQQGGTP